MAVEKFKVGTIATLMSTELNGKLNNELALATVAFNNVAGGGGGDGFVMADVELVVSYAAAPTAGTGIPLWFLKAPDGTYEDGGSSVTPARLPATTFPLRAVTGAQRIVMPCAIPWGSSKALAKNDGTGQTWAASGNTLKILPATREGV